MCISPGQENILGTYVFLGHTLQTTLALPKGAICEGSYVWLDEMGTYNVAYPELSEYRPV